MSLKVRTAAHCAESTKSRCQTWLKTRGVREVDNNLKPYGHGDRRYRSRGVGDRVGEGDDTFRG